MLGPPDLTNQTSNFLFENVNKMLSTFVPAHHRRQSNQVKLNQIYLTLYYYFLFFIVIYVNWCQITWNNYL
jgi:hypothetical protein